VGSINRRIRAQIFQGIKVISYLKNNKAKRPGSWLKW
jgi:hypothetical protein